MAWLNEEFLFDINKQLKKRVIADNSDYFLCPFIEELAITIASPKL